MARKKHLQDVDAEDMEYIDSKFKIDSSVDYNPGWANYDFKISPIKCKNKKQKEFLNALKDETKQICIGIGSPGVGKSYISLYYALNMLKNSYGKYKNIIIVIPTAIAGHPSMNLGFLPGDFNEKISPFIEADTYNFEKILQASGVYQGRNIIQGLIRNGVIRFEIVGHLRGRNFDNAIILGNEIENLNKSELLLLLTRLGENSKIILTGDTKQCDRTDIVKSKELSGVEYAIEKLKDLDEVSVTEFTADDIVRNQLITKILEKWGE